MTPIHRRRPLAAAVLLSMLALAGCQTTESKTGAAFGDGNGKNFRERRGWTVNYVAETGAAPAHCRGARSPTSGPNIAFIGAERESGFRLSGLAAEKTAGKRTEIVAMFDNGDRQTFPVRTDADGLLALAPTAQYEDFMHAFGRARHVSLRDPQGELLGEMPLNGSSWAINATDECRRMHAPPRIR